MNEELKRRYKFIREDLTAIYDQIQGSYDAKTDSYILSDQEFHRYYNQLWCIPFQLDALMEDIEKYMWSDRNRLYSKISGLIERFDRGEFAS